MSGDYQSTFLGRCGRECVSTEGRGKRRLHDGAWFCFEEDHWLARPTHLKDVPVWISAGNLVIANGSLQTQHVDVCFRGKDCHDVGQHYEAVSSAIWFCTNPEHHFPIPLEQVIVHDTESSANIASDDVGGYPSTFYASASLEPTPSSNFGRTPCSSLPSPYFQLSDVPSGATPSSYAFSAGTPASISTLASSSTPASINTPASVSTPGSPTVGLNAAVVPGGLVGRWVKDLRKAYPLDSVADLQAHILPFVVSLVSTEIAKRTQAHQRRVLEPIADEDNSAIIGYQYKQNPMKAQITGEQENFRPYVAAPFGAADFQPNQDQLIAAQTGKPLALVLGKVPHDTSRVTFQDERLLRDGASFIPPLAEWETASFATPDPAAPGSFLLKSKGVEESSRHYYYNYSRGDNSPKVLLFELEGGERGDRTRYFHRWVIRCYDDQSRKIGDGDGWKTNPYFWDSEGKLRSLGLWIEKPTKERNSGDHEDLDDPSRDRSNKRSRKEEEGDSGRKSKAPKTGPTDNDASDQEWDSEADEPLDYDGLFLDSPIASEVTYETLSKTLARSDIELEVSQGRFSHVKSWPHKEGESFSPTHSQGTERDFESKVDEIDIKSPKVPSVREGDFMIAGVASDNSESDVHAFLLVANVTTDAPSESHQLYPWTGCSRPSTLFRLSENRQPYNYIHYALDRLRKTDYYFSLSPHEVLPQWRLSFDEDGSRYLKRIDSHVTPATYTLFHRQPEPMAPLYSSGQRRSETSYHLNWRAARITVLACSNIPTIFFAPLQKVQLRPPDQSEKPMGKWESGSDFEAGETLGDERIREEICRFIHRQSVKVERGKEMVRRALLSLEDVEESQRDDESSLDMVMALSTLLGIRHRWGKSEAVI